jgi:hypothetical protein
MRVVFATRCPDSIENSPGLPRLSCGCRNDLSIVRRRRLRGSVAFRRDRGRLGRLILLRRSFARLILVLGFGGNLLGRIVLSGILLIAVVLIVVHGKLLLMEARAVGMASR